MRSIALVVGSLLLGGCAAAPESPLARSESLAPPPPAAVSANASSPPGAAEVAPAPLVALDPEVVGNDVALSGFVLVWADAEVYLDASETADKVSLATFDGAARRERLGFTVAMRVRSTRGDFVEVGEVGGGSADPSQLRSHCGWLHFEVPEELSDASLFVRRQDLAPVLGAELARRFDDGTAVKLTPGTPILRANEGLLASFIEATWPLRLPDPPLAFSYREAPMARQPKPTHTLVGLDQVTLGSIPVSLGRRWFAPLAHRVEARGRRSLVSIASHCGEIELSAPSRAVRRHEPAHAADRDAWGTGMRGGMMDRTVWIVPRGTPLKSRSGRVVATPQHDLEVERPTSATFCRPLVVRFASAFVDRPELSTSDASFTLCAPRSAVVQVQRDAVGKGLGGLGPGRLRGTEQRP